MQFSIIIPYYHKYEKFFNECIESVLKQSFSDFECLVVITKLEEESYKRIGCYDKRIVVCYSDSTDQSIKRNAGIEKAHGEYIVFLDSDDVLDLNYLLVSNQILERHKQLDLIVYNHSRNINELGGNIDSFSIMNKKEDCWHQLFGEYMNCSCKQKVAFDSVWAKVFKTSVIIDNNIRFVERLKCAEDAVFVRNYSLYVERMIVCEKYSSYFWRYNPNSTMNNANSGFLDIEKFAIELLKVLVLLPEQYYSDFDRYLSNLFVIRMNWLLKLLKMKELSFKNYVRLIKNYFGRAKQIKRHIKYKFLKRKVHKCLFFIIHTRAYFMLCFIKVFLNKI